MPKLTLGQAAKEANKAKSTILDAIKNGNLSAPKGEKGQYEIDTSELFRVFPRADREPDGKTETGHLKTDDKTAILEEKVRYLEREVRHLEHTADDLRADREDLREDRDHWRRQATLLLTDQSDNQPKAAPEPKPAAFLGAAPWFWSSLALAASSAAALLWWNSQH
jgi:hypothetical protein